MTDSSKLAILEKAPLLKKLKYLDSFLIILTNISDIKLHKLN